MPYSLCPGKIFNLKSITKEEAALKVVYHLSKYNLALPKDKHKSTVIETRTAKKDYKSKDGLSRGRVLFSNI